VHPDKNRDVRAAEVFRLLTHCYTTLTETGVNHVLKVEVKEKNPTVQHTKMPVYSDDTFIQEMLRKMHNERKQQGRRSVNSDKYENIFRTANAQTNAKFDEIFRKMQERKNNKKPCQGYTKDHKKCQKSAREGSSYCHVHNDFDQRPPEPEKVPKVQCQAKTKGGSQCTKNGKDGGSYCHLHLNYDPSAPQPQVGDKQKCIGVTKAGTPCQNYRQKDREYCKSH